METNVATGLAQMEETQFLVAEATEENAAQKKNAPESAQLGASLVACATSHFTSEYSTEAPACQIAAAPSLDEIESEIAAAARTRIEAALRDLNETHARIERERAARANALNAAQERVSQTQSQLNGLDSERAAMEHRAQTFLVGDALKLALGNIHLGFNAKQLELEDALATAQADAHETEAEMQAAAVTDALEIQMTEQYLEQLQSAAPDVAETVRLAASAEENIAAAQQAVTDGLLNDAEVLLEKAKAGSADSSKIAHVEQILADARQERKARDLSERINAMAKQPRALRRIRELVAEAEAMGVADKVELAARRALKIAHDAADARFAQARPIADRLAADGYIPVVGDGRIEAWKEVSKKGASTSAHASTPAQHGSTWTLDRVMILDGDIWHTKTPRVPVTRRELPIQVQRSRWFNRPSAHDLAPSHQHGCMVITWPCQAHFAGRGQKERRCFADAPIHCER